MLKKSLISLKIRKSLQAVALFIMGTSTMFMMQSCDEDSDPNDDQYPVEILGEWEAGVIYTTIAVDGLEDQKLTDNTPHQRLTINSNGIIEMFEINPFQPTQWVSKYRGQWAYNEYYKCLLVAPNEDTREIYYVHDVSAQQLVLVNVRDTTLGALEAEINGEDATPTPDEGDTTEADETDNTPCVVTTTTVYKRANYSNL